MKHRRVRLSNANRMEIGGSGKPGVNAIQTVEMGRRAGKDYVIILPQILGELLVKTPHWVIQRKKFASS